VRQVCYFQEFALKSSWDIRVMVHCSDSSLHHTIQNGSGTYSASYPEDPGNCFFYVKKTSPHLHTSIISNHCTKLSCALLLTESFPCIKTLISAPSNQEISNPARCLGTDFFTFLHFTFNTSLVFYSEQFLVILYVN